MKGKLYELELRLENLQDMVQMVDEYSRHMTAQMWTMLGVFITLFIFIMSGAAYFLIRNIVNDKVNKEIDKRLINLLKENPPVFNASGSSTPDENKRIYLNSSIDGISQLIPDQVMIFNVSPDKSTYMTLSDGLIPILRINENGIVEIEIPDYHENNGEIHWKILWPRMEYENKI
ncbi:hypothetical protein [Peribacillus sp. NPDC097295]|uniref:hypothetical protein n=1 Tax=Peribacillus sp. NPDC097295 TaxID=3364402 RepID=UPI0037FC1F7F